MENSLIVTTADLVFRWEPSLLGYQCKTCRTWWELCPMCVRCDSLLPRDYTVSGFPWLSFDVLTRNHTTHQTSRWDLFLAAECDFLLSVVSKNVFKLLLFFPPITTNPERKLIIFFVYLSKKKQPTGPLRRVHLIRSYKINKKRAVFCSLLSSFG